ncbi:MAG: type II secretion system F family protein [Syntrophales bacterium]|nr:type II secretion system F family protein [Syntrophales bacterium]
MPTFSYRAINQNGSVVSGVIEADNVESASLMLSSQGFIPSKVEEDRASGLNALMEQIKLTLTPIKPEELILMTKQFRTMLAAGLSMVQILDILEHQVQNMRLKNMLAAILLDIKGGKSLTEAFRRHEKILSPLYVSMVNAGETSGSLPEVLERLVYLLEHEHKVKSDIKSALQYPKIVVGALVIAFFILLTFVIPTFVTIFEGAGIELPLPTKIALALYYFLSNYWYILLVALVGFIVLYRWYVKTPAGRLFRDGLVLKIPVLGSLFQRAAMARFASIFSILQTSGIPVLLSLDMLAGTIGNEAIASEFRRVRTLLEEGRGISSPLRSAKYFTPMVVDMVAVGEETGALDEMLRQVAVHYDDEVEYAVKRLSDAIGPALIVCLAFVVGFFALAIFLPLWDLTQMVR